MDAPEPQSPGPRRDRDEVDRRFREIVAGLSVEADRDDLLDDLPPVHRFPPGAERHPSVQGAVEPAGAPEPHQRGAWREGPSSLDDEGHFEPPPVPPLPAGDLHFWAILVGLVGGPLLVLLAAVVPVLATVWATVGALLTVAGFVLLVLRQPDRRPDDDPGAQV